jgi:hypothetical protein
LEHGVCADKPGAAGNKDGRFGTVHRSGDSTATPEILLGARVDSSSLILCQPKNG